MLAADHRPSPRNKFNQTDKSYLNVRYNVMFSPPYNPESVITLRDE